MPFAARRLGVLVDAVCKLRRHPTRFSRGEFFRFPAAGPAIVYPKYCVVRHPTDSTDVPDAIQPFNTDSIAATAQYPAEDPYLITRCPADPEVLKI